MEEKKKNKEEKINDITLKKAGDLKSKELSDQGGPGSQYETSHWNVSVSPDRSSGINSWDKVISDKSGTEAWSSISNIGDPNYLVKSECPLGSSSFNRDTIAATTNSGCSVLSMATGTAGPPAHYPSLKANNNMMTGPGSSSAIGSNRGWGSDGKQDSINGGRAGAPNNWGSPNFNLNLNPNANPSAWPVLGHEGGGGVGIDPSPACNSSSLTPSINGNGNIGSNCLVGADSGSGSWVGIMRANETEQHPVTNTNLSFNMDPVTHNPDGPNHIKQHQQVQEPMSPIHGLTGWGGQSPTESSQLNGDTTGSSVWGSGDTKAAESPKDSGWDSSPSGGLSAWGRQNSGGGSSGSGGWGDWGKSSGGGEASKGWDSIDAGSSGSGQDQQLSSWGQQPGTAPASEGSGDSSEGRSHRRDRSSSMECTPLLPRDDLDPRVLSNSGWGQTPIRQHTVWEMEEASSDDGKSSSSSDMMGGSSSNDGSSPTNGSTTNPDISSSQRPRGHADNEGTSPSGWHGPPPQPIKTGSGWGDTVQPISKTTTGTASGWGDPLPTNGPKTVGTLSWCSEEKSPHWEDEKLKNQPATWGEAPKSSHGWGNSNGGSNSSSCRDWAEPDIKNNESNSSMWEGEECNGGNSGWKESPRGSNRGGGWGKPSSAVNTNSWGENLRTNGPVQGGWGSSKTQESSSSSSTGKPAKLYESTHPDWAPSLQLFKEDHRDGKQPLGRCKRRTSQKVLQQHDAPQKRTCADVEVQHPELRQTIVDQQEPGPPQIKEEQEESIPLQPTQEHVPSPTEQDSLLKIKQEAMIRLQPRVVLHRIDVVRHITQNNGSRSSLSNQDSESIQAKKKKVELPPELIKEEQLDWNPFQAKEDQYLQQAEKILLVKIKEEEDNWEYEQVGLKQEAHPTPIYERGSQTAAVILGDNLKCHYLAKDQSWHQRQCKLADSGCARKKVQMTNDVSQMNSSQNNSETMSNTSDKDLSSLSSETDETSISDGDGSPLMEDTLITSESISESVSADLGCLKCNICEKNRKVSQKRLTEKTHTSEKWRLCHTCEEKKGLFNDHTYHKPMTELQPHQVSSKGKAQDSCEVCGHSLT